MDCCYRAFIDLMHVHILQAVTKCFYKSSTSPHLQAVRFYLVYCIRLTLAVVRKDDISSPVFV